MTELTFEDIEAQIGDIVKKDVRNRGKDVSIHHIPVAEVKKPLIEQMLRRFQEIHEETVKSCITRAEELEAAAADLRNRAAIMVHSATQIPTDYKNAMRYEEDARVRAQALMLVNPKEDT